MSREKSLKMGSRGEARERPAPTGVWRSYRVRFTATARDLTVADHLRSDAWKSHASSLLVRAIDEESARRTAFAEIDRRYPGYGRSIDSIKEE